MSQDWNVDEDHDLNGNLDDSLSGLCIEMDNNTNFNMTDTLLALPLFDIDQKPVILQYPHVEQMINITLNAPTSPAMKIDEESLTYLNQGQPYELKFQYIGGGYKTQRLLKSYVKIAFHDRRLQYCEEKQIQVWRNEHPYERILEVDTPLSRGIIEAKNLPFNLNMIEVLWDPCKTASVYVKINCISTEFTPKKHGGEKGVPFRLQIDTYILNMGNFLHIYSAYAQVKIFKPKGADRKHKTDKEKFEKQSSTDKSKFQPSCPFTILVETIPDAEFMCKPNCSSQTFFDEVSSCVNENHISSTKNYDKNVNFKPTQAESASANNEKFKDDKSTKSFRGIASNASEKRRDQSVENVGSTLSVDFESHNQLVKKRMSENSSNQKITDSLNQDDKSYNLNKSLQNSTASSKSQRNVMITTSGKQTDHLGSTSLDLNKDYYYIHEALLNSTLPNKSNAYQPANSSSFVIPSMSDSHLYPNTTFDLELNAFASPTCENDLELELVEENGLNETSENNLPIILPIDTQSTETATWLEASNFNSYIINAFRNFSPLDMRRLSRQDLIDICGVADGIRLNNAIQCIPPRARITIYMTRKIKPINYIQSDIQSTDPTLSTNSSHSSTSNNPLTLSQEDLHKQFNDSILIDGVFFAFHLYDLTREELFNRFCENYGASNFSSVSQIYLTYPPKDETAPKPGGSRLIVVANDKVIQHLPDGSRYFFCVDTDSKQGFSYILMECCECTTISS